MVNSLEQRCVVQADNEDDAKVKAQESCALNASWAYAYPHEFNINLSNISEDELWVLIDAIRKVKNYELTYWTIEDLVFVLNDMDIYSDADEIAQQLWHDMSFRASFRKNIANTNELRSLLESGDWLDAFNHR